MKKLRSHRIFKRVLNIYSWALRYTRISEEHNPKPPEQCNNLYIFLSSSCIEVIKFLYNLHPMASDNQTN